MTGEVGELPVHGDKRQGKRKARICGGPVLEEKIQSGLKAQCKIQLVLR